jgi:hypothetical protein
MRNRCTISYNVDDNGTLHIYKGNRKLAEISDCGDKGDVELFYLIQTITDEMEDNQ